MTRMRMSRRFWFRPPSTVPSNPANAPPSILTRIPRRGISEERLARRRELSARGRLSPSIAVVACPTRSSLTPPFTHDHDAALRLRHWDFYRGPHEEFPWARVLTCARGLVDWARY